MLLLMKKLLGIMVLGLLFSVKAYAGVNEPGVTSIAGCDRALKYQHKKLIKKYLKELIKKNSSYKDTRTFYTYYLKKKAEKIISADSC